MGGPVSALTGLACAQATQGLEVSVAATFRHSPETDVPNSLKNSGVREVTQIGPTISPLMWNPRIKSKIGRLVSSADIVHIYGVWEQIQYQTAQTCQRLKVPYIFEPCGMLDPWSLSQKKLKKWIYLNLRMRRALQGASLLHFTSDEEARLVNNLKLTPPGLVRPLGIDTAEFASLPPRVCSTQSGLLNPKKLKLIFLGRVHYKKGVDLLISAFGRLKDIDCELVIAGPEHDPKYSRKLRELIDSLGIGARIQFTGMLRGEEKIKALASADLFILPSHQENFGIAVVESLAAGTPVLISDHVNIHPLITQIKAGETVSNHADALEKTIRKWLTDSALRTQAGERGRKYVLENLSWQAISRLWTETYLSLDSMRP